MKKKFMQVVVIVVLTCIPALYAFIYLYAYWDPTSYSQNISIAVVNNDAGATINDEYQNIGDSLVAHLKTNTNIHWVFTDGEDAKDGVLTGEFYAILIIPKDFTACIATAATKTKTKGTLYFKANDKYGSFASSLLTNVAANIETTVSKSITESLVDTLAEKLRELPNSLQQLSDALGKLDAGSAQLSHGMSALIAGQTAFNNGLSTVDQGLNSAGGGSRTISDALSLIAQKSELFSSALNSNAGNLENLSGYSGQYADGFDTLSTKLSTYITASSESLQETIGLISYLKAYLAAHPESISDDNMQRVLAALNSLSKNQGDTTDPATAAAILANALDKLNATYARINSAIQNLPTASAAAAANASTLTKSLDQLATGASTLSSSLNTLATGADTLNENAQRILTSEQQLLDGVTQLNSGIEQIKASVDQSLAELNGSVSGLDGFGAYAADPIDMKITKIGETENNGTAMTPFIVSLCLWLGGIMLIIVFTTMERLKFSEFSSSNRLMIDFGLFRFQLLAILQAVCLGFTVHVLLGLEVNNVTQYYGILILGGVTFITIIQVLVLVFQDLGKLLSIIFMLLQLTACGGILSTKLVPPFYRAIHPYMPMTYTVNALRDNLLRMDRSDFHHSMEMLAVSLAAGIILVILLSLLKHLIIKRNHKDSVAIAKSGYHLKIRR